MSRALNLDASVEDITRTCAKLGLGISTIEALQSGGSRVVLLNAIDAAAVKKSFGSKVISGAVTRTPSRMRSQ